MKKLIAVLVVATLVATAAQAAPSYTANLGEDVLSPGVSVADWGEKEPSAAHLGGYGGAGQDTARMVWGNTASGDTNTWATVVFPTNIYWVDITSLDGIANDSYTVLVDGNVWGSYSHNPSTNEYWLTTTFSGTPGKTLQISSLSTGWWGAAEYGTLAIDKVEAYVPVPGAILLSGIGTAFVGWLRRRRAL